MRGYKSLNVPGVSTRGDIDGSPTEYGSGWKRPFRRSGFGEGGGWWVLSSGDGVSAHGGLPGGIPHRCLAMWEWRTA